jgi:hypothetical protein
VSKGERNRQQARERIAQMRALEARRRRRRNVIAGVAAAVAVAAAGAGIGVAISNNSSNSGGGGTPHLKLAALSTLGPLQAAPAAGSAGPENVPIPAAAPLAGTTGAATGQVVDGIKCDTKEQLVFHTHAHLTIIVNGSPRQVPADVGIPGACIYYLHTHAADGVIHIESPVRRTYTLGDFFDEWGQPLGPGQVGPQTGTVAAIYNGQRYLGNPRDIPLTAHAQIQLEVGRPLVAQQTIKFPANL